MSPRTPVALGLSLLLAALGCSNGDAPAAEPAATAASATVAPTQQARSGPRALALAPVENRTTIDRDLRVLQEAAEKAPEREDSWVLLGRAWVLKARESADPGYYLHAKACAELVLERDPKSVLARNLLAIVLLNDHDFAGAKDLAEQLLLERNDELQALGTLSDALLELGRIEESVTAAQRMVDLKPNLPSYSRASYLAWLHGDAQGAKNAIRFAIDAGHDAHDKEPRAWVLVQAAMLFWHEGDYAGASAGFDQALAWYPDYPPALVGKGRVALAKGENAEAVKSLERAYGLSPLVETAWLLGDAKTATGDTAGASEAYGRVEKTGKQGDPRTLAAFLAAKGKSPEEAVRLAEAEAKKRGGPHTDDVLAWAYYRAGRLAEAKTASQRATQYGTKDATLLYHAGAILAASGERAKGLALVRDALARNPAFDVTGAAEARALVAEKTP
jgi:tetratricopeptide (TPR) repeat protein